MHMPHRMHLSSSDWSMAPASPAFMGCLFEGNQLPRIEKVRWIECVLNAAHQLQAAVADLIAQKFHLGDPDAVFARKRAAESESGLEDLLHRRCTRAISSASFLSAIIVGCRFPSPAWPNVPITRLYLRPMLPHATSISVMRLRGTVASSSTTVLFSEASAGRAARRADQS